MIILSWIKPLSSLNATLKICSYMQRILCVLKSVLHKKNQINSIVHFVLYQITDCTLYNHMPVTDVIYVHRLIFQVKSWLKSWIWAPTALDGIAQCNWLKDNKLHSLISTMWCYSFSRRVWAFFFYCIGETMFLKDISAEIKSKNVKPYPYSTMLGFTTLICFWFL